MAIAHDVATESHTGALGSISEASFSWSHTGAASGVDGVLVFVMTQESSADDVTSVTYGGVNVPAVTGGRAADTTTEPASCKAFFLGATDIPQGTQTVVVNRTNNVSEMYGVCSTQLASVAGKIGAVHEAGIVLLEENQALAEQNVTDGSPGTDSVRYAAVASGLGAPPAAGTNSTTLQSIDMGAFVCSTVVETTAGQGSRPVGFSAATDDTAAVHLAVKEVDGAAGTNLVIQDGAHAHVADNIALTQVHNLTVQEAGHGHTADAFALTQDHNLAVQETAHAHTADNLALTQVHSLTVADATHAHVADNVVLTEAGAPTLVISDGLHSHTADNLALTQAHALVVADSLHAHTADALALETDNQAKGLTLGLRAGLATAGRAGEPRMARA